jgi:Tfp pilus assembly protein PilF
MSRPIKQLLPLAAILFLTLIAYHPAMEAGFIWDDDQYVTGNQALRDVRGLKDIWQKPETIPQYYPLVHTVFWLEYHGWGLAPAGYHLVNILLHAFNAMLVFLLLRRLAVPGAMLSALVFALHPVMVESVAWVTELKNVLSAFFYLWSLLHYLCAADNKDGSFRYGHYLLSFGLFVCALLSKTVTATLPLAILIILWWKNGKLRWREVLPLLPWLVTGAGFGLMTAWLEKYHVLAAGSAWSLSITQRVLVAGRALWFYLGKLFWPASLTFIYPRWNPEAGNPGWYAWPAAAAALSAALFFLRKKTGRGPLAGLLFFMVSLFPALGFIDVYPFRYSFVADHFQYLASLGIIAAVIGAAAAWIRERRPEYQKKAILLSCLLVAALTGLTVAQARIYRDPPALWRDTVKKNPACWMAYNNLGFYHLERGQIDSAEACFIKSVQIDPSGSDQLNNLGLICLNKGQFSRAVQIFKMADPATQPNFIVFYNLGLAYLQMDSLDQAGAHLKKALNLNPNSAEACVNLGLVHWRQKKISAAEILFIRAIAIEPLFYQAHLNLGLIYQEQGKMQPAEHWFRKALEIKPDFPEAQYSLAQFYLEQGRYREAREGFAALLKNFPGDPTIGEQLRKIERLQK